jgi:opacity protein-like surface antigen
LVLAWAFRPSSVQVSARQRQHQRVHRHRRRHEGFPSIAFGEEHDEWNLAWAVYAGLGFDVTDNFTMELAYRYLDMGDGASGNLVAYDGTDNFDNPMEFNDITSHDVKVGFRYKFN